MLTHKSRWTIFILVPAVLGLAIGYGAAPTTKTITVEKVVEKPVDVIKYVPAPPIPVQIPAPIPFGMSEDTAYKYRHCPDIVTTYVIVGENHTVHSGQYFLEDHWPNFGTLLSEEDLGTALNESSKIIKLTIQKNSCWK